jgi:hypothetical protein
MQKAIGYTRHIVWILCLGVIALIFIWGIINYANSSNVIKRTIESSPLLTQKVSPFKWHSDLNKLTDHVKNQFDANVVTFLITLLAVVVLTSSVVFLIDAFKKFEETTKLQNEIIDLEKNLKRIVCDTESLIFIVISSELLIPRASSEDEVQTFLLNCTPYVQRAFSVPGFVVQRFRALSTDRFIQSDDDLKKLHRGLMVALEERQDKASKEAKL